MNHIQEIFLVSPAATRTQKPCVGAISSYSHGLVRLNEVLYITISSGEYRSIFLLLAKITEENETYYEKILAYIPIS